MDSKTCEACGIYIGATAHALTITRDRVGAAGHVGPMFTAHAWTDNYRLCVRCIDDAEQRIREVLAEIMGRRAA